MIKKNVYLYEILSKNRNNNGVLRGFSCYGNQ